MNVRVVTRSVTIVGLVSSLTSCISYIDVQKYSGNERGFRYSLPRPHILVTPRSDGGIDVQPVMLPDTDNEYVVTMKSIVSSYKYDLGFEQGLLKSFTGKQDSAALAAQVATNTGAVLKARTEAQAAAEADAAKARAAAAKSVADAQQAVAEATAARDTLLAQRVASRTVSDSAIVDAEVNLAKAKKRLEAAVSAGATAFNAPSGSNAAEVWGPVLYAVHQDSDGRVTLKAVVAQQTFATIAVAAKTSETPKPPAIKLSLKEAGPFKPNPQGRVIFQIASTKQLAAVDVKQTLVRDRKTQGTILPQADNYILSLKDEGRVIEVSLGAAFKTGDYAITPAVKPTGGEDFQTPTRVDFSVER